jgi:two-component system, LytTR family, sensor kinase
METSEQKARNKRTTIYFICQIVGWEIWCAIGLFFFAISSHEVLIHWKRWTAAFACSGLVGVLITHLYRGFVQKHGWLRLSLAKAFRRVIAASIVLGVVLVAAVSIVWLIFGVGTFRRLDWILPALLSWTWAVLVWNLLYFGFHYFEAYRREQIEKLELSVVAREAQLQRLTAQLNPHFMFNCLNSVRALITEDPGRARDMLTELSGLLRYTLQSGSALTVPLSAELEIVNTYLKLETMRFEERLAVHIDAAPETLGVKVPAMLLQSLVENGVKHGIEKLPSGGEIRVHSELNNGSLHVQVSNSGQLTRAGRSGGIGLASARERLRLLYGKDATLVLENCGNDSVRADITIPVIPVEITER